MRRGYGFLILSLSGLCGAVALPGQQEQPTAESMFKNIVSFKGDKASDVIPAMQFMSASLGEDCDYCHTKDRASDEKRAKGAARSMIAMQREINKNHFNGRNQVTCATCHGGHEHPVALPPVEGLEVRAQRSQTVVPADVLAAYGKAVGADAAASVTGIRLQGSATFKGVKSPFEATYSSGKFALVSKGDKGDQKQGFNGSMAWFTTPTGIQSVPLVYAAHFVNEKAIYTGPDSLPKLTNPTGGTAKIGAKDNVVITGTTEDKTRVSLFFDKQTGLLSRAAFYYPTILGSMAQINDYSDYKKVKGVLIPMTIANHASEGDTLEQFRSAHADAKIDASVFDAPKS